MKLHLDFSGLTHLAERIMPEGIDFSLAHYARFFLPSEIESATGKNINLSELDSHDAHKALIGQYLPDLARIGYLLTEKERGILGEYGAWMEALAYGRILPFTVEQKRFILVGEGKATAHTEFEKTWQNVIKVRQGIRK